jgi:alpha 1,3-glucosidase
MMIIVDWNVFLWLLLVISPVFSVKDYLFKKCEQNGFCHRNRHFASQISSFENYEPRYSLERSSLNFNEKNGQFQGIILKQLKDGSYRDLLFDISIVEDYNLRFQLDEANREQFIEDISVNKKRYSKTGDWAFKGDLMTKKFRYQILNNEIILIYGANLEYKAVIKMFPFKIVLYYYDKEQIILNDRDFLNLEHYRTKESLDDENSVDVLPEESTFNAYKDTFQDSKNDRLPFGPESVALDFTFVNYTHIYGIPEHADSLSLKDTTGTEPYRLFNVDIFEYEVQSKLSMYGSIPLMIAVKPDVSAAIFWVNAADTYIDIKKNTVDDNVGGVELVWSEDSISNVKTHWMSENGIIDVILIVKSNPLSISKAYAEITGNTKLPNLFSIGYHQCRWNYNDENDVLEVHSKFDEHEIPYDTIWLDIEYTDDKKYFTWNKALFPNPDQMMSRLAGTKRQLVVIIDPHIKDNYYISDAIIDKELGIKDPNINSVENTYHGHCWPGDSIWIDSLNPNSQKFWDSQFKNGTELLGNSINGHLWNDMNEPSVFNGPETTSPKDLIHFGNYEHRSIHNIYGLTFHESTYHALIERNPNQRPFILTRSFFAGSQRTTAMWTGDNMAKWEYLKESIPMVLTMNVVGFPFAGADVGGFFGNPSKELLVRWYQTGIWYPFFRAHAHIDSRRREPWIAGSQYTEYMKQAIKLRYKLLPLLYTEFWKSSMTGEPILKPLVWEVPNDKIGYEIDNEFFMGGLLVHPVVEEDAEDVEVYFPCDGEIYYDFFDLSNKFESGQYISVKANLDSIPVYLRGGNIITTKDRYRRSAQLMKYDPYTLYVAIGSNRTAKGKLYIDDGETFAHEIGDWIEIDIEANDTERIIKGNVLHNFEHGFIQSLRNKRVTINKIIIIGSEISDHVAIIEQTDKVWDSKILSEEHSKHFTIRNPNILITDDWTIKY